MGKKQSVWSRFRRVMTANANAAIDKAEDPAKMLDQMTIDYRNDIVAAERAAAVAVGSLRQVESKHQQDIASSREWGEKALAASRRADELREKGAVEDAEKFDNLAKAALGRQMGFESQAKAAAPVIAQQSQAVEGIKKNLMGMKEKLGQLQSQRDQLVARDRLAAAQETVQGAIGSVNASDPTSELSRLTGKIERREALVAGQAEIQQSTDVTAAFAQLEGGTGDVEIEARLAELKQMELEK